MQRLLGLGSTEGPCPRERYSGNGCVPLLFKEVSFKLWEIGKGLRMALGCHGHDTSVYLIQPRFGQLFLPLIVLTYLSCLIALQYLHFSVIINRKIITLTNSLTELQCVNRTLSGAPQTVCIIC